VGSAGRITVVVADDHPVVLRGLEALIAESSDLTVAGAARDGEEAVAMCLALSPHVAVLDVRMPGLDGLAATRRIRDESPITQVVVLSAAIDPSTAVEAFRAGAIGFLPKETVAGSLVTAIREAAAGRAVISPEVASGLVRALREPPAPANPLAPRELAILAQVASGSTNEQIARSLGTSVSTVKAQLSALFEKVGATDRASALAVCFRRGWIT
jgi:DNA-binding NarL/FixJ family response regulator